MLYQFSGDIIIEAENNKYTYFMQDGKHVYIDADKVDTVVSKLDVWIPNNEEIEAVKAEYAKWLERLPEDNHQAFVDELDSKNLDPYKQHLLNQVALESMKFEDNLNLDMYFTSSLGFKVNGDRRTKSNIQDIITFFDLQAQDGKIEYRDYNNEFHQLFKEDVQLLLVESVSNGNNLYAQKWELQTKINSADSLDALSKIEIGFTMMDFSKHE